MHLAVCRIVAVAAQLFWFFPSLSEHVNLLRKNAEFIEPQMLIRGISALVPREAFFNPETFTALYWLTAAVGVAALIGLWTRVTLFFFALGTWIFVAHLFSYGDRHHTEALFAIFLMVLVVAPAGERLSLDALIRRRRGRPVAEYADTAIWPLKLLHVLLAMTYFSAGMSKMIASGLQWMNGYTLQSHAFGDALHRGYPVGIWLGSQRTVAIALSVFTIALELFFWVSLLFPRAAPFFFLSALGFHIGLYATAGYDFFQHMVLLSLLLVFLAPEPWRVALRQRLASVGWRRQEQAGQPL